MGLLTPALLAASIAIAVPVWLHLTRRPPKERQPFPSLMFLGESPLNATRRRSIRDPLLLALRVLAMVLLVAAFSRPFLAPGAGGAGADGGVREIALLFDRSYSMAAGDRMDAGKAAARRVFSELREGDRLTLVAFDDAAQVLGPATRDVDVLRAALDSIRPGEGGTSYAGALRLAESVLSASPGPRREVVIVSDFAAGRTLADPEVLLPPGTRVRLLPATTDPLDDLTTEDVSLRRSGFAAGERIHVVARIANLGARAVSERAVSLTLDGARVGVETVSLKPGASTAVEFPPFSVASGAAAGHVRVGPDDLAMNDARFFVAEPRRAVAVMIVEPDGSGPRRGLHLRRALELARSPTFTLRRRTDRSLRGEDLAGLDLLILDGVPFPAGETGARLSAFVEAGGGLIAAAGDRSGGRIPELADGLLPAGSARSVARAEGGSLGRVEYGHPIFSAFRDPGSGDLGAPRVDRYRRLSEEGMRVLARFDDGSPALLEADLGLGRSLVWATTLGDAWTDLPLQPVYLPFVHRLLLHAAGWREDEPSRLVGSSVDPATLIPPAEREDQEAPVLVMPGGERRALDATGEPVVVELSGIYEVRDPATPAPRRFAVNVDPRENGLIAVDSAAFRTAAAAPDSVVAPTAEAAETAAGGREPGRPLWWPLLLAASVLFLLESVLSNVGRARATVGGVP